MTSDDVGLSPVSFAPAAAPGMRLGAAHNPSRNPNARQPGTMQVKDLQECKEEVLTFCIEKHCNPILVRLTWHDAGTFNKDSTQPWPRCGGANGSFQFAPGINHGANAGQSIALELLQPIKDKRPEVGWADLIQLASSAAIEQ